MLSLRVLTLINVPTLINVSLPSPPLKLISQPLLLP